MCFEFITQIRNASILFYSTLVQRIFGVNRSNAVKSRKNWCGFSDDIRIRKIASLALTSIIHPSVIMTTLNHLFDLMELFHESIPVKRWCNIRLNILHGLLLQVVHICFYHFM
ncbi:unnamed protein product [Schistosoma mattheei]|uniref:Uncharacterized protein n=1 Tax=Schistosoma mattheei TaxID=31246 RepID=A0A3P8JXP2_9TREM|nr:unnamed protein product [Schistosoma mattheei]